MKYEMNRHYTVHWYGDETMTTDAEDDDKITMTFDFKQQIIKIREEYVQLTGRVLLKNLTEKYIYCNEWYRRAIYGSAGNFHCHCVKTFSSSKFFNRD